jgi:predicted regulator of Ras-like GTPase activity (Roadblock/LC7/MglB family)
MDAAQALRELMDLSSQVGAAVIIGRDGATVASSPEEEAASDALAGTARELVGAAFELGSKLEVSRVEIELEEGALFVVSEGGFTIAARTGPEPTSGLVIYDLRTCLRSIDAPEPKKKRASRTKAEEKAEEKEEES